MRLQKWITLISLFIIQQSLAQTFTGSYFIPSDAGGITLNMQEDGAGKIFGSLQGNGANFSIDGEIDTEETGISYGFIETPDGTLLFEAYLEEPLVYFYILELNAQGEIDYENAQELVFERQTSPSVTTSTNQGNTTTQSPANPLGSQETTSNPLATVNPLAIDPFAGSFHGDGLRLNLEAANDQYSGQLEIAGQTYPVVAVATSSTSLTGGFEASGATFTFSATLQGSQMILVSDGSSYSLTKAASNPLPA